ncbi:Dynein light chain type 1/2 [Penicillium argentinense]|uniref:Dynein light chain type 1/2 n=1 Tax=Penicillium argentinense TaxID=1131581 RepID=A0A9W9EQ88_9EURO|nr:Dynein light chain type 1/2 [Penicillium argentinense]KAJ5086018.1 Dynein light chain type 1/2 [Penicillium argentinense]
MTTEKKDNMEAQIKSVDMTEDMQQEAIALAIEAMEKYHIEKDIAQYIKKEFDSRKGATWHCVVGRNFGSFVTHETKHFIYFYLGHCAILLFKTHQATDSAPNAAAFEHQPPFLIFTTVVMAFCITFGTHEFTGMLEGYEQVRAYCYNFVVFGHWTNGSPLRLGQHWNGHCVTRWPFFTICFIPLIPLSTHKYKEVLCYTCRVSQDLRDRPDITPDTRPPPHMAWGPQPPPQAYGGGYPQQQQQQPPQQQQQMGYK